MFFFFFFFNTCNMTLYGPLGFGIYKLQSNVVQILVISNEVYFVDYLFKRVLS